MHKEDGVCMIWILCNMLLGRGGSHLNEFAAYHQSQEKANQSLPLHSIGWVGGGKEREKLREVEMWHERKLVSLRVLFTTTTLCQGFSWGTLVLIKTGPILNSNPLVWLASSGYALSNYWNRWMFLHYHGWTFNKQRPVHSRARVTSEFTAHLFRE